MLQCDFAYMIGTDMFDDLVRPELAATCRNLDHAFYHLDGEGQLPHLDSMLAIDALKGIQWIPGNGKPPVEDYPQVVKKVLDAGKRYQFFGGSPQALDKMAAGAGTKSAVADACRNVPL